MTESARNSAGQRQISAAVIREATFETNKYGRGYTKPVVDAFVNHVAGYVDHLERRLQAAEAEVQRLQQRVIDGPREDEVVRAVNVISNAQRTADTTVAEADAYSARVMSEAQNAYDDARRRAAELEQQAEQHARQLAEEAEQRRQQLEHEADERLRQLTLSGKTQQDELDKQTAYLRTLRDATRTQMQKFLEGMLFHVAEEYGRAHPLAAAASVPAQQPPFQGDEYGQAPESEPVSPAQHAAADHPDGVPNGALAQHNGAAAHALAVQP